MSNFIYLIKTDGEAILINTNYIVAVVDVTDCPTIVTVAVPGGDVTVIEITESAFRVECKLCPP